MNNNFSETSINTQYLKEERQAQIRHLVEERGQVTVLELSDLFKVSEATIRRDLEEMDGQWVRRAHGGAVRLERAGKEPPVIQRIVEQVDEKMRIGKAAAAMILEGETVFLGSGTTVKEIARHIPEDMHLTVITNSLPVVNELAGRSSIELIVIGGLLRSTELSMVGHIAEQAIREFRADKVFMGMRAVDAQQGFTNDFLPETMTDRAILAIAPQVIIVSDHSKFGRVSSVLVAPVSAAQKVITDDGTSPDCIEELRALGVEVMVV
jgi:DeoR/GlpR family transcriptional regulator of sugar metabolism